MSKFSQVALAAALAAAVASPALTTDAAAGPMSIAAPATVGLQGSVGQAWYRGGYRGGYYRRGYGGYYGGYYRRGYSYNPGAAIAAGAALGLAGAAAAAAASQNNYYYGYPGYYAYPGYGYYGW
ncbi:hypothetical protein WOC76_04110 [Methylocystis sp. IM3]|uniref:hypothetical protein n=1 Tax=unclassified Methylocystis TaxID=2625913 RepID=UPI000FC3959F|nr:MAG: hypothetical protein EKK29_21910 [Hyphomicrobiales bacterium]